MLGGDINSAVIKLISNEYEVKNLKILNFLFKRILQINKMSWNLSETPKRENSLMGTCQS